jgi:hypothetical protein
MRASQPWLPAGSSASASRNPRWAAVSGNGSAAGPAARTVGSEGSTVGPVVAASEGRTVGSAVAASIAAASVSTVRCR